MFHHDAAYEAALRALESAWICYTHGAPLDGLNGKAAGVVGLDDASRYAAIAIAGSLAPAPADAEAQLRQTYFWEWWLRDAIPSAWQRR